MLTPTQRESSSACNVLRRWAISAHNVAILLWLAADSVASAAHGYPKFVVAAVVVQSLTKKTASVINAELLHKRQQRLKSFPHRLASLPQKARAPFWISSAPSSRPPWPKRCAAGAAEVQGERREVTVIFLDIINFTSISHHLDSEEIYLIIDEAMRLLVQMIYQYEGTVDKFTGDGLMALFGTPIAHENDPERAIRAALDMQAALQPLQDRVQKEHAFRLQTRIGINTGLVVAGKLGNDLHMEYTVIGDTVNLASRLESAAEPDTILVSFDTYQRTHPLFKYEVLPPMNLKGMPNAVPVYRPVALRKIPGKVRGLPGMQVPMIGRSKELDQFYLAWQRLLETRNNQFVLITGEAGLGKSRLVAEFRQRLDHAAVNIYEGSCVAYARSTPFWVIASLIRGHFAHFRARQYRCSASGGADLCASNGAFAGAGLALFDQLAGIGAAHPRDCRAYSPA